MAKNKRKTKKTHRRRRIGAMAMKPTSPMVRIATIAIGFFFGDKLNTMLASMTGGKIDGKIVAAGELGIGAMLMLQKKNPSMFKTVLGGVFLGAGLKAGLKEFGIMNGIAGYGAVPVLGAKSMRGYGAVPVLGGYKTEGSLNGYTTEGSLNGRDKKIMAGVGAHNRLRNMARKANAA